VDKGYSLTVFSFLLTVFILLAGLTSCMAGGCGGESTEAGRSVNPAEVRESSGEKPEKPRSAPNPYTDDVIQMKKKMQSSEDPQPKADTDGKGGEVDKSE
jgi:hypothetical protein